MKARYLGLFGLLLFSACGGESPFTPDVPTPTVTGTYSRYDMWLVQFVRNHDNYTGSFRCSGSITIATEAPSGTGAAAISGYAVVGSPCPPQSFDLSGSVARDGSITFTSGGPRPPVGQCPVGSSVAYAGRVTGSQLSARGATPLDCPGPGEGLHQFTYVLDGYRNSY